MKYVEEVMVHLRGRTEALVSQLHGNTCGILFFSFCFCFGHFIFLCFLSFSFLIIAILQSLLLYGLFLVHLLLLRNVVRQGLLVLPGTLLVSLATVFAGFLDVHVYGGDGDGIGDFACSPFCH
ncbi:hypothetical protein V8G54_005408 [Vigna mungo]|uniref:Uncharacterized protein n=1 Tax=Vigna mungo TaxID=3915 RepID=A0AAQ3NX29_VIGMU